MKALKLRLNNAWNWFLKAGYYDDRFIFIKVDLFYAALDIREFSKYILQFDEFKAVLYPFCSLNCEISIIKKSAGFIL